MNSIPKTIFPICLLAILAMFTLYSTAFASTQITGTVTAKQAGSVKVEFEPYKTAGPKIGDRVDFIRIMDGFEVKAGKGEVVKVGSGFAWVRITRQPVKLKMTGIIALTENSEVGTEKQGTQVFPDENKKSRQLHSTEKKEPVGVSRSPKELKEMVVRELVRLHYSQDVADLVSKTNLEIALDMFNLDHGTRHDKVSERLLQDLQAVGDQ
jgi:hypothetical protein